MALSCSKWLAAGLVVAFVSLSSGCAVPVIGWRPVAWPGFRSAAIPDRYPLGSMERAHFQQMQTNGEAYDFILHSHDFVGETAELTPDGKDHILEIGARMRSVPFPVLVERSENNSNPQLDADRRATVAMVLSDLGNADADQRTIVSMPYGRGITSIEGEIDFYRFIFSRGFGGNLNNGANNAGGGFAGGGFGGGGFGGGGFGGGGFGR